jgi:hypothetical protein
VDSHSSRIYVTLYLKRPTRTWTWATSYTPRLSSSGFVAGSSCCSYTLVCSAAQLHRHLASSLKSKAYSIGSYLVLLQVGFALPSLLPVMRCAFTTPFHPYLMRFALELLTTSRHLPKTQWLRVYYQAVYFLWHFP